MIGHIFFLFSGQAELQAKLDEDKVRLDALKRDLAERFSELTAQLQNVAKFSNLAGGLLPWLRGHGGIAGELRLTDLGYAVLEKQYAKCKVRRIDIRLCITTVRITVKIQWNLSIVVTRGPKIFGLIKEVAGINWPILCVVAIGSNFESSPS